jgi:hypothetical protein
VHNYFRRSHVDCRRGYDDVFVMLVPVFVVKTFVPSVVGNKTAAGSKQSNSAG